MRLSPSSYILMQPFLDITGLGTIIENGLLIDHFPLLTRILVPMCSRSARRAPICASNVRLV